VARRRRAGALGAGWECFKPWRTISGLGDVEPIWPSFRWSWKSFAKGAGFLDLVWYFRNPNDPFRIVIVRDMWLTGFDAPSLDTMYPDKPMRGTG
jgi:hypothetical protein